MCIRDSLICARDGLYQGRADGERDRVPRTRARARTDELQRPPRTDRIRPETPSPRERHRFEPQEVVMALVGIRLMLTLSPARPDNVSCRLWSLWDVIKVKLDQLVAVARLLEATSAGNFARANILSRHEPVGLAEMIGIFKDLDLAVSADHARDILAMLVPEGDESEDTDADTRKKIRQQHLQAVTQELDKLADELRRELKTKVSVALTDKQAVDLFEHPRPFDSDTVSVNDRFSDAVYDIQESANCRALSRPTACVFHLMRVLEVGLNALALDLKIPWPNRNDWQDVINAIEGKIKEIEKGSIKFEGWHEKRQFYADAATQFTHFKDGWRNYAIHFHAVYDLSLIHI